MSIGFFDFLLFYFGVLGRMHLTLWLYPKEAGKLEDAAFSREIRAQRMLRPDTFLRN